MSYIRLIISDRSQTINSEVHGYFGDAVVAALTAEPETAEDLALALARFITPQGDASPLAGFRKDQNRDPYDAGIVMIDLTARVVAIDSSYFLPSAEGSIRVLSEFAEEDIVIPYRLSDDWLLINSIAEYEGLCGRRREERLASQPLHARAVLFGEPLLEFLARECFERRDSRDERLFTDIHRKWLMTVRDDLRGRTPRDLLLERLEFIDFDLHSRALQWSFTKICPPPLPSGSEAYRFAGFGTHENVVYYDLVRHLLGECSDHVKTCNSFDMELERLEQQKNSWLSAPNEEYDGRSPTFIIECERRRLNMILSAHELIIDEDCEICQAMAADFDTPGFWHLDGCNMDEDFAFSFYKTLEEFEEAERRREEFNREFDRDWKAGKYDKPFEESLVDFDGEIPF